MVCLQVVTMHCLSASFHPTLLPRPPLGHTGQFLFRLSKACASQGPQRPPDADGYPMEDAGFVCGPGLLGCAAMGWG